MPTALPTQHAEAPQEPTQLLARLNRRPILWAVRWLVAAGLVILLLAHVKLPALFAAWKKASWGWAVAGLWGLLAAQTLAGLTWWYLLLLWPGQGPRPSLGASLRSFYLATALGSLTPANLGSDLYRAYTTRNQLGGFSRAVFPILLQRWTSASAGLFLATGGAFWLPLPRAVPLVLALSFLASLAVAPLAWWLATRRHLLPPALERRRLGAAVVAGWVLGLAHHALAGASGGLLGLAIERSLAWWQVCAAMLLVRAAALVPFSPAGLGLVEGGVALLFPLLGSTAEAGLACALLGRVAWVMHLLLGVLLLLNPNADREVSRSPVTGIDG